MAVRLLKGQTIGGVRYPAFDVLIGLGPDAEDRLRQGGDGHPVNIAVLSEADAAAVNQLVAAGTLAVHRPTVTGAVGGVPAAALALNAGSGNSILDGRVTVNPGTDVVGAQRLLVPTSEVFAFGGLGKTMILQSSAPITTVHLAGISSSVNYAGATYVIGGAEVSLLNAKNNAAIVGFSALDNVKTLMLILSQGATAQTATLAVIGYSHVG